MARRNLKSWPNQNFKFRNLKFRVGRIGQAGQPGTALAVAGVGASLHVGILWFVVARAEPGIQILEHASWSGFAVIALVGFACARALRLRCGTGAPWLSWGRVALAVVAGVIASSWLSGAGLGLGVARMGLAAVLYLCMLLGTRELGRREWSLVMDAVGRRRAGA